MMELATWSGQASRNIQFLVPKVIIHYMKVNTLYYTCYKKKRNNLIIILFCGI